MSTADKEELVRIARTYYPASDPTALPHHAPPESPAWEKAWDRAMAWRECDALIQAMQTAFPLGRAARFMQPRKAACIYCILLLEDRDPDGGRHLTRIVGAVSILAPVYLVYVTKESIGTSPPSPRPRAIFSPEGPEKSYVEALARLIEQHLGYRPFPRALADLSLPDIHVDFLHSERPTLLTALFANHLEDLP